MIQSVCGPCGETILRINKAARRTRVRGPLFSAAPHREFGTPSPHGHRANKKNAEPFDVFPTLRRRVGVQCQYIYNIRGHLLKL